MQRSFWREYRGFLGLFWMTAPLAWFYAIPVERWCDSYRSAQLNLALLGVVSIWRVALLARILHVTTQAHAGRTTVWTLFAASLEVVVVMFVGAFSTLGEEVVRGMSGMRNSPEEEMLLRVLSEITSWAAIVFLITGIGLFVARGRGLARPLPEATQSRVPWVAPVLAVALWSVAAIGPQKQLRNNFDYDRLVAAGRYDEAMTFLITRKPEEFSHYKRFAPDPYASEVWEHLAGCLDRIDSDSPAWVRSRYLYHVEGALSHWVGHGWNDHRLPVYISILEFLDRVPEGRAVKVRLRERLEHLDSMEDHDVSDEKDAQTQYLQFRELIDDALGR